MTRATFPASRVALSLLLWLAPFVAASAQDGDAPATDTPETLAAMQSMWAPLPAEIPSWESLPADVRRELSAFHIEMHRWHVDPAQRFVMVGGRRVEEGGVLGQELWLREIRPTCVVVQYRKLIFQRAR
jgi:hypothetical protein